MAHAVAVGVVAPRPAIRADVVAALAAQVGRLEPGPGWAAWRHDLVAAFAAHLSDLPSEFAPAHRTATPKSATQKAPEATAFAQLVGRAACFSTAPVGSVPAMVEAELHDRLLLIETIVAGLRHRPAA